MELNLGNSLFEGLNDKQGLMICGYEWGESKADQASYEAGEEMVIDENATTTFSSKTAKYGPRALEWSYDNNIIKWFELWGHPLSREELGGDFEKSIVQTNWCNTQSYQLSGNTQAKLKDPEQIENFLFHIEKLEPSLILFMGSELIKALEQDDILTKFEKIMGARKTGEPKVMQKESGGYNFTFWSFEKCEVICFPHPSGSWGISDAYIELFSDEMVPLLTKFKQSKNIQ